MPHHRTVSHRAVLAAWAMMPMRHFQPGQLVDAGSGFHRADRLAERARHANAAHGDGVADNQQARQLCRGRRWHAHDGAILQQHAANLATRGVQQRLDDTGGLHLRAIPTPGLAAADNQAAGVVGDRDGVDHRNRARLEAAYGHAVAWLHAEHQRAGQARRHLYLGAVSEDQPIDLTARGEGVLRHLALELRQLRGVEGGRGDPHRRPHLRDSKAGGASQNRGREQNRSKQRLGVTCHGEAPWLPGCSPGWLQLCTAHATL